MPIEIVSLTDSDAFRVWELALADAQAALETYLETRAHDPYDSQAFLQACVVYAEAAANEAECRLRYQDQVDRMMAGTSR